MFCNTGDGVLIVLVVLAVRVVIDVLIFCAGIVDGIVDCSDVRLFSFDIFFFFEILRFSFDTSFDRGSVKR